MWTLEKCSRISSLFFCVFFNNLMQESFVKLMN